MFMIPPERHVQFEHFHMYKVLKLTDSNVRPVDALTRFSLNTHFEYAEEWRRGGREGGKRSRKERGGKVRVKA